MTVREAIALYQKEREAAEQRGTDLVTARPIKEKFYKRKPLGDGNFIVTPPRP